jgi:hypothetical protein
MTDTTFKSGTVIASSWLNDVNRLTYDIGSTASGKGASLVGLQDAGGYFSTDNVEAALQEAGMQMRGLGRDIRTFTGIVADGVTDDRVAFQNAVTTAKAGGYDIWFPAGVYLLINFPNALSQVFISGKVSLRGQDGKKCGFILNKQVDNSPVIHDPLFCFGITSKGSAVDAWTGVMDGIGFVLKAGCKTFERCCHFYEWQQARVQNCWYDGRAVTFALSAQAGGFLSSNVQPTWATGQTNAFGIIVDNNEARASAYYQNAESIAFSNLYDSAITRNRCYGFSDDMAIHGGANNLFAFNVNKPLAGRFYFEDVQHLTVFRNYIEKCKDPAGAYFNGTLYGIRVAFTPSYVVNNSAVPNTNISIIGNRVVMPEGSYTAVCIGAESIQDGLLIADNVFESQGTTGTADAATSCISITSPALLGAWTGPAGNPDFAAGGVVRLRNTKIYGNVCTGSGWSATEGTMGVSFATGAANVLGPIDVYDNTVGAAFMPYSTISFRSSNRALAVSSPDPWANVSAITLYRESPVVWTGIVVAGDNLTFAGHPTATPLSVVDRGGLAFFAPSAGSIRGVRFRVAAAGSGANLTSVRIQKTTGGATAQLGVDTAFASISPTTNFISYICNFFGANMNFAAGDKIQVQLFCSAGQLVPLTGNVELLALYN